MVFDCWLFGVLVVVVAVAAVVVLLLFVFVFLLEASVLLFILEIFFNVYLFDFRCTSLHYITPFVRVCVCVCVCV